MADRRSLLPPELAAMPTPVFVWERRDDDFVLVDWNPAAERQTLGRVERHRGSTASVVYANQPAILRGLASARPGTPPFTEETDYVMLSTGDRRRLDVAYIARGPDLVIVATGDLTGRFQTEGKLEESERRYRTIVEGAPDGIVVHRDGTILYVNEAFARLVGAPSPGSVVGTPVLSHVHPDDRAGVVARVRGIEEGGVAPLLEERLLRADGTVVYAEVAGIPTTFDGEPAVQAIVRDVSERRKAQALFVALSEQALTGVAVIQDDKVRYANPRAAELFGFASAADMVGVPDDALVAPASREYTRSMQQSRLDQGSGTMHYTCTGLRRDGTEFDVEVFGSVVELDGRPALVSTLLDASEHERMAAQLRQAQKMDAVGRLAGGIAHDFNNILTAILSYADLVLGEVPEGGGVHADVLEIRTAAERAAALTRQLLAFSRQQSLETRVVDVNEVVTGMARMLQRLIDERIVLTIQTAPETPRVMADRGQLEQVLLNLAVNARDAMPATGRLTVSTGASSYDATTAGEHPGLRPGVYSHIRVTDTGPGIPDDVLPRIFEPFFTTKPSGQGTGLGLSVVYGIVKQSGGYVMVDSTVGEGTTFTILLPALPA